MAYTVKIRTLPGSPMMAEYECPECGVFEILVERDEHGDPPARASCPDVLEDPDTGESLVCGLPADLVLSAPKIKYWSRDPVAINPAGSTRDDKPDPRALDTEPLATGKMTKAEWLKYQRGITLERRYQRRLKAGKISKRIQVGGGS